MTGWLAEPLREPFVVRALAELVVLSLVAGTLGCWIVLAGISYGAESLAHSMLPGLAGAALVGAPLVAGGAAGLAAGATLMALAGRVRGLDSEVAVAVVITALFGLGVLLGLSPRAPAGLDGILFGDLLAVGWGDVALAGAVAVLVAAVLWLVHPSFLAVFFDRAAAPALGRRPARYEVVLALLLALATLVAVQALGNLLVVALLVGPAATARLVSDRLGPMMAVGVAVGLAASVCGLYLSFHAGVAGGAAVTACLCAAFLAVLLVRMGVAGLARARG